MKASLEESRRAVEMRDWDDRSHCRGAIIAALVLARSRGRALTTSRGLAATAAPTWGFGRPEREKAGCVSRAVAVDPLCLIMHTQDRGAQFRAKVLSLSG